VVSIGILGLVIKVIDLPGEGKQEEGEDLGLPARRRARSGR